MLLGTPNHAEKADDVLTSSTSEKDSLINQAQHLVQAIQQLESSLDDTREPHPNAHPIIAPLLDCVRQLEETHNAVKRLHQERFEEVKSELWYSPHLT
jgi:hypothetical protein